MSKRLAVTKDGRHKIGKKLFFTNENLVHRKVKKAFITQGGAHRLVFSSGTVWEKWSCKVEEDTSTIYTKTAEGVGGIASDSLSVDSIIYQDYSFWVYGGFEGKGSMYHAGDNEGKITDRIVGYYIVYETEVYKIISVDSENGDVTCEIVDACEEETVIAETTYSKGSITYGTLEAEEGELPEDGVLVDGSATDDHCVLEINGNYYYYVRGEEK